MKYLGTLLVTAWLALTGHALGAALLWTVAIALFLAIEETRGDLWKYFGRLTGARWLERAKWEAGFVLIVAPALLLQCLAAWCAFRGELVNPFWLALLIGARIGDSVFSHAIPSADQPSQPNPGLATAALYAVDALLLIFLWHPELMAAARESLMGFAIGAGFFAAVLPALRLSKFLN